MSHSAIIIVKRNQIFSKNAGYGRIRDGALRDLSFQTFLDKNDKAGTPQHLPERQICGMGGMIKIENKSEEKGISRFLPPKK